MKGYFEINGILIPNTVVDQGAKLFARSLFRAEAVMPTNFYLGLTSAVLTNGSVLTDAVAGEISGNGYARQQCVRNTSDWTVEEVNGIVRARSKVVTFTASADWSSTWNKVFLTDVVSGAGNLFAFSGSLSAAVQTLSGLGPPASYIFNIQG